jgi:hypothetical protein
MQIHIDGACYCGEIKYEAEVDPEKVFICNCTDCQTMSGAAFHVNVPVEESNLKFVSGEPAEYVKTAESGNKRAMGFCRNCGTPLYATNADGGPRVYGLRVASSSQRDQLTPKQRFWLRSQPHWLPDLASIPGKEQQ